MLLEKMIAEVRERIKEEKLAMKETVAVVETEAEQTKKDTIVRTECYS